MLVSSALVLVVVVDDVSFCELEPPLDEEPPSALVSSPEPPPSVSLGVD